MSSAASRAEATGGDQVDDLFLARCAPFAFHGARLTFDLATTVFASAGVDPGSALLLRHLQSALTGSQPAERILDLGCGHGVLGIVLLALDRSRRVTFVDRDALACHYTGRNLARNGLDGPDQRVLGSLGYDQLPVGDPAGGPFDVIVSNIPGKAGEGVISHLIRGAGAHSRVGSLLGLVVVEPLAELVTGLLATEPVEVLVDRGNKTHHVVVARWTGPASQPTGDPADAFAAGIYDRSPGLQPFRAADLDWAARTVFGLDEFDSLSHATRLLRGALRGMRAGPCLVVNPGQGHRAVIAARSGQQPTILAGRDLLSLEAAARCLADNGLVPAGDPGPDLLHDLTLDDQMIGPLPPAVLLHADDRVHGPWLYDQVRRWLAVGGRSDQLVLTGRAGILGRIEVDVLARAGGRIVYRQSRAGFRALRYQAR